MKSIILFSLVVAGLLTGCTKEEPAEDLMEDMQIEGELAFFAGTDFSSGTKTALDGRSVIWAAADPIMIFGEDDAHAAKVSGYAAHTAGVSVELDWTSNISGKEGAFTTDDIPQYALYPCDSTNASISGSVITFKLSETQIYAAGSFGPGANVSVGKVRTDGGVADIKFKNVCGYLKLQVSVASGDAATVGKIVLTTKGTEKLWGTFTADASLEAPVATYKSGSTDGGTSLTLKCPDGVDVSTDAANPTVFHIVAPAGSLASGFKAEFFSKQGHLMTAMETDKDITIVRNQVNRMQNKTFHWIPEAYAEQAYIESTGYQFIDTGYGSDSGWRLNIKAAFSSLPEGTGEAAEMCGAGYYDAPRHLNGWGLYVEGEEAVIRYLKQSEEAKSIAVAADVPYLIDASWISDNGFLIINGDNYPVPSNQSSLLSQSFNAYICASHLYDRSTTSDMTSKSKGKWYYCDMYDCTNTQIRQFIPVYLSTGAIGHQYGMYDILNDVFYTNAFTGTDACDFNGWSIRTGEEDLTITFESFVIEGGRVLGTVDRTISVCVPSGTDMTNLVASFTSTADKVCVDKVEQTSGTTANDFSGTVTYTLWKEGNYNEIKVKVHDFDLPVIWIETPDHAKVTSKNKWMEGANAKLYASNNLSSLGSAQIKGRGNTSWGYVKKPYTIKLDKKAAILGMTKDKRWNLLANWMDRTDMRNDIALQLARVSPGLDWTPGGKFVELILNGEHMGNYYLCEHIKISKDRVNITAIDEEAAKNGDPVDLTGGYLMEFDTYYDETNKFKTSSCRLPVNLKDPDWTIGFSKTYIRNWLNTLESKLVSDDISSTDYQDYLDIDSYIDWWFVHEMTGNWEPNHPKSSYMYKDKESATDNKIHAGPCWDFDYGTFMPNQSWNVKNAIWNSYLFNDPDFVARTKEKWNAQKSSYDAIAETYIDAVATEIEASVATDKTLWPCTDKMNMDNTLSFDDAVARMKASLQGKINWMDTEINKW